MPYLCALRPICYALRMENDDSAESKPLNWGVYFGLFIAVTVVAGWAFQFGLTHKQGNTLTAASILGPLGWITLVSSGSRRQSGRDAAIELVRNLVIAGAFLFSVIR